MLLFLGVLVCLSVCYGFQWPAYRSIGLNAIQRLSIRRSFDIHAKPLIGELVTAQLYSLDGVSGHIALFSFQKDGEKFIASMPTQGLTKDEMNSLNVGSEMDVMVTNSEGPIEVRLLTDEEQTDDYDDDDDAYEAEELEEPDVEEDSEDSNDEFVDGEYFADDDFKPHRLTQEEEQEILQSYSHTFDEMSKGSNAAAVQDVLQWSEIEHLKDDGLIDDAVLDSLLSEIGAQRDGSISFDKFVQFNELIELHLGGADMYRDERDFISGAYSQQFEELSKDDGKTVLVKDVLQEDVNQLVDRGNITMSEVHALLREVRSDPKGNFTYEQYEEFLDGLDDLLEGRNKKGKKSDESDESDSSESESESERESGSYEYRDHEQEDRQTFLRLTGDPSGKGFLSVSDYIEWAEQEEELYSPESLSEEGLSALLDLMGVRLEGGVLSREQFIRLNHVIDYIEEGPDRAATVLARSNSRGGAGGVDSDPATRAAQPSEKMQDVFYRLCRETPAVKSVDLLQWFHNQGIFDMPNKLEEHGVELLLDLMGVDPVRGHLSYSHFMKLNEAIATILYGDKVEGDSEDSDSGDDDGFEGEEEEQGRSASKGARKELSAEEISEAAFYRNELVGEAVLEHLGGDVD